jgi:hypothetical protein
MVTALSGDVPANLIVAAGKVVFLAEAAMNLSRRVALLGRSEFIGLEDGIDDGMKGSQNRSRRRFGACVATRLGFLKDLPNLASGVMKSASDVANAHAVAMGESNRCVMIHRKHPCLRSPDSPGRRIQ